VFLAVGWVLVFVWGLVWRWMGCKLVRAHSLLVLEFRSVRVIKLVLAMGKVLALMWVLRWVVLLVLASVLVMVLETV
jgi:hypothetical protein